ncbi:phage head closure protein [Pantoea ananatis]|uniref:phage head closure protein n=1 Tax=Pantoea ananas TaxID=553 RepID=UPI0019083B76|nr:phage head closure protein [Pantoea ananatis]
MKQRQSQTSATWQFPDPGELDKRVTLRQRIDRSMGDFDTESTYQNVRDVWAKVRQVGATTLHESAQTEQAVTHYFTVRYRSNITSDYELVFGGSVYAVKRGRDLNSAKRFLLLECEELGLVEKGDQMYG